MQAVAVGVKAVVIAGVTRLAELWVVLDAGGAMAARIPMARAFPAAGRW